MKSFKQFSEEPTMTTGPGIAGTSPGDPADWVHPKKKKKHKILTRSFIEILGKRRRVSK